MNVSTSTTIRLSGEKPPEARQSWRCTGCGTNYSPDVRACRCSPLMTTPVYPETYPVLPPYPVLCTCYQAWHSITAPPPCPAHGQAQVITVTC
jgi:hypothetical protein